MFFEYPYLLWLLLLPLLLSALYVYRELSGRVPHFRVSKAEAWNGGRSSALSFAVHVPFALRMTAMALLIIGLARPRSSYQAEKIDT